MTADTIDSPTPEFRAHLEWEIARTIRREARLGTGRAQRRRRRMRAAGIVAICLALGTVSNFASAQVRDGSRRDSLLEAARAELSMAALRLDLARARLDDASRRVSAGAISKSELALAEAELRLQDSQIARARINVAEIQAAAQAPRNELNAPQVDGRDFVKERLALDLVNAQQRLAAAERQLGLSDQQMQLGLISKVALTEAKVDLSRAHADMAVLAERLALRREFIEKGTSMDQMARRLQATQLQEEMGVAVQSNYLAKARLDLLTRQRAAGAAPEVELLRAQLDLKERELQLSQLAAQLKKLGRVDH